MNVDAAIFWLTAPTALSFLFLQLGSRAWIHTSFGTDHGGATRRETIRSLASLKALASGSFSCQVADCFHLFSSSQQHGTAPMQPLGPGSPSSLLHSSAVRCLLTLVWISCKR